MKNQINTYLFSGAVFSLGIIVIGYFLWTILIPIQDLDMMTDAELYRVQQEVALNYPLGRFMLYLGFFLFTIFTFALLFKWIYLRLKGTDY